MTVDQEEHMSETTADQEEPTVVSARDVNPKMHALSDAMVALIVEARAAYQATQVEATPERV